MIEYCLSVGTLQRDLAKGVVLETDVRLTGLVWLGTPWQNDLSYCNEDRPVHMQGSVLGPLCVACPHPGQVG